MPGYNAVVEGAPRPKQSKATVRLFADGVEKENVELSEANNWKHEFKDLPKYRADGSLIEYTVKEDAVSDYDTDITGNAKDGSDEFERYQQRYCTQIYQ